jgi:peptide-methionine (S)-S-oxide reductase
MRNLVLLFLMTALTTVSPAAEAARKTDGQTESLVLGGGCFWCTEAAYELMPGVKGAVSGYAGGHTRNPTYQEVCGGDTGHAEVIRVDFDPSVVSLDKLLDFFWVIHDPTTLNRQGPDEGTQYRSVIFYANEAQKIAAEKSKAAAQEKWGGKIVTEIAPLETFYPAEEYHQDYFRKNPNQGYCRAVVRPKVEKAKKALGK